ncbi:MAG: aminoacyl-tRNA hydrolase [bacterium]|nr:aminoacyl-tRNA hydrolase [bacterium]
MKIVIGLGNPGRRYEATAHNLGFDVADEVARRWRLTWRESAREQAVLTEGLVAGSPVLLAKPMTFMNLSGQTVAALARQRSLGEDDLLVIADDVSLPIGRLRIRPRGSHGGHNGLRSVIERLGHGDFARLRVGIRPPWDVDDLVAFVLSRLPPLERAQLGEMTILAADAVECWVCEGSAVAADRFNGIRRFAEPAD